MHHICHSEVSGRCFSGAEPVLKHLTLSIQTVGFALRQLDGREASPSELATLFGKSVGDVS
jgi:hypothetical protein